MRKINTSMRSLMDYLGCITGIRASNNNRAKTVLDPLSRSMKVKMACQAEFKVIMGWLVIPTGERQKRRLSYIWGSAIS